MVALKTSFPNGAKGEVVHYHSLLEPILQQRFLRSSWCLLGLCLSVSYWLTSSPIFSLKTITSTVFCGVLVFLFTFPFYVFLKGRMTTTVPAYDTLAQSILHRASPSSFLPAVLTFFSSSFAVTLTYLCGHSQTSRFQWLTSDKPYELPRLNERSLYILVVATILSILAAVFHIFSNQDVIPPPVVRIPIALYLKQRFEHSIRIASSMALGCSILSLPVYALVRSPLWQTALFFTRCFHRIAASKALPHWPVGLGLFLHSFWVSYLISFLWCYGISFFRVFLFAGPSVRGRLISMRSADPNATLITGLRSDRRPFTQMMAYEELAFIASRDPARIRLILQDTDRKDPIWSEILKALLSHCERLSATVAPYIRSNAAAKSGAGVDVSTATSKMSPSGLRSGMPEVPLKDANIYRTTNRHSASSTIQILEKLKERGTKRAEPISSLNGSALDSSKLPSVVHNKASMYLTHLSHSPFLRPFQHTLERQNNNIFPVPWLFVSAVSSLTKFVLQSLKYDTYGVVARDVSRILCILCDTYDQILSYKENVRAPEAGVSSDESSEKAFTNFNIALETLRFSIIDITESFSPFFSQLDIPSRIETRCKSIRQGA
ncbi:spindle pole body docking protein Cut11 [Schizosaccharomyces japonicus yFS275]|uniref:Spindle pole body docking protein Cut11 n=1 Tax=Schizosaccharomyces japonicus (strain yFS275 / FY16936) TaxID=402676 RepID=B6K3L1_SCHJY|nr:spindle pole body docking protein Cut11 [Schizosaccharomyces japonicus yFS275]EEB08068.1 spindle pole body docking protein Cut11 [Schizosaccharomyces japonicus yFS275]